MSIVIKGGLSTNTIDVDSNKNLSIVIPLSASPGYVVASPESDGGNETGYLMRRILDSSMNNRLRIGYDKILWQDTFNHNTFNTSKYIGSAATQTITLANGFLNLNANNVTASPGPYSFVSTYKTFSLINEYSTFVDIQAKISEVPQNNSIIEFGLGIVPASTVGTSIPSDGMFFRISGGTLNAVSNYNGFETNVFNIFTPSANTVYHYLIVAGHKVCEFWVDDILLVEIDVSPPTGSTSISPSLPVFFRNYNPGGVITNPIQLNVVQLGVTESDMDMGRDWKTTMALNGQSSISAPNGQTPSSTANIINNSTPILAVATNTIAGYTTLGGQFAFNASAGTETDYIAFAYQNPMGAEDIPGKTLVIHGIKIDSSVSGATAGVSPTLLQWTIGIGSTDVSLLTQDNATLGTRAPRRLNIGTQSIAANAVVGANCDRTIDCEFVSPLMVEAGTYCHIILKVPIGLATANQIIRGIVEVNGYFE